MRLRWQMMLIIGLTLLGIVIGARHQDVQAQGPESCPAILEAAFTALNTTCAALSRNEACAASGPVTAVSDAATVTVAPGETFDLTAQRSLSASTLDTDSAAWGALVIGQGAGLPANTPELVTMWLFGGAELADSRTEQQRSAAPVATCYATVVTDELNVRNYPASIGRVMDVLEKGDVVIITGRLADTSWWRIDYPDPEQAAWVFSGYARTNCSIVEIPTVLRNAPALSAEGWYRDPFQIATLRTDPASTTCTSAPPPGLLLQPPESGRSRFALNGVTFDLDATLYVQANVNEGLLFQIIEDTMVFTLPNGTVISAPPGSQLRVPLAVDGTVAPGQPQLEPLDVNELAALPLERLPHPLTGLPRPVIEIPARAEQVLSDRLIPGEPVTLYFDNRAGVMYEIRLVSDAFPVLSILAPDREVVRPFINQGRLSFSYWPVDDRPHIFELAAGSTRQGTYNLSAQAQDLRLCRPGGNRQSQTLRGGEDHAGNIWFGRAGEVVTLTASGDISPSASSIPRWRLRIAAMFQETATVPPIVTDLLEGYNADSITWEVPETGYYWIEVWTAAGGTTAVTSTCQ